MEKRVSTHVINHQNDFSFNCEDFDQDHVGLVVAPESGYGKPDQVVIAPDGEDFLGFVTAVDNADDSVCSVCMFGPSDFLDYTENTDGDLPVENSIMQLCGNGAGGVRVKADADDSLRSFYIAEVQASTPTTGKVRVIPL